MEGLLEAERKHELETEIVDLFPRRPPLGGFEPGSQRRCRPAFCAAPVRGVRSRAVASWAPGAAVLRRRPPVPRHAFRLPRLLLCAGGRAQRRSQCHCADVTRRRGRPSRRLPERPHGGPANTAQGGRHVVSIISGEPDFPQQQALVQGFSTGVRRALPGVEIRIDYSFEYDDQATCERIANRQIDAGSGVVFATAGDCGLGALSAAAIRGVWGVASQRGSLAPRPAHSRVCVQALRSPRRV